MLILTFVSVGALGCVAPSVIQYQRRGGIDVDDHVEYYDIHGKTLRDLRIDAHVNGPVSRDTTWFAVTHYQIHWTYSYYRQPTLCRLTNVKMPVNIIVTLPRWVDSSERGGGGDSSAHRRTAAGLRSPEPARHRAAGARGPQRALTRRRQGALACVTRAPAYVAGERPGRHRSAERAAPT